MINPTESNEGDKLPEAEAEDRFDRAIKNALATPPKPHAPPKKGDKPSPAQKGSIS